MFWKKSALNTLLYSTVIKTKLFLKTGYQNGSFWKMFSTPSASSRPTAAVHNFVSGVINRSEISGTIKLRWITVFPIISLSRLSLEQKVFRVSVEIVCLAELSSKLIFFVQNKRLIRLLKFNISGTIDDTTTKVNLESKLINLFFHYHWCSEQNNKNVDLFLAF